MWLQLGVTVLAVAGHNPQVGLTWNQSSSPGVIKNCVYRSKTSGGPYTQLNCSTQPIISYTDGNVSSKNTYFYVVTASDGTNESGFSNEAHANIP